MNDATENLYGEDLAYIQARAHAGYAKAALPFVIGQLRAMGRNPLRVVDVGCGAGVTTAAFLTEGFSVFGIEPSEPLAGYARRAAPDAEIRTGSAYDVDLPDCDAIVAIGEPLIYHSGPDVAERRLAAFFTTARGALSRGGMLIFDFISSEGEDLSSRSWSSSADWALLVKTTEDRSRHMLVRDIVTFRRTGNLYRRSEERHVVTLLSEAWIRNTLHGAGFNVGFRDWFAASSTLPRRRVVTATV